MVERLKEQDVVLVSAARLPVGRLGGSLKDVDEIDMGVAVIQAALERAGVPTDAVDEVIMGQNFRTGKTASNSARVMGIRAGIPMEVPGFTVNKHCAAGIKTVNLAAQAIRSGDAQVVIAGGVEQMSAAAFFVPGKIRWGTPLGHQTLQDQLIMRDPICDLTMGETAEKLAGTFSIGRQEQDEFAVWSQEKAETAIKGGKFTDEIVPFPVPQRKGDPLVFDQDEHPRFGTTLEALARLKPVFAKDGTVTAGNASGMNDGAGALVVTSGAYARAHGLKPMARLMGYVAVGVDPSIMGTGPVPATQKLLKGLGLNLSEMSLIELNEAFACMCVYYQRQLEPDLDLVNPNGGAIALGHPIAATGSVILTRLLYELRRRQGQYGLATMCIGGGQGVALAVENLG